MYIYIRCRDREQVLSIIFNTIFCDYVAISFLREPKVYILPTTLKLQRGYIFPILKIKTILSYQTPKARVVWDFKELIQL